MKLIQKLNFIKTYMHELESFENSDDVPESWIHSDGRIYDPELKYKPPVTTVDGEYIDTNYDRQDYIEDNDDLDDNNYSNTTFDRYNIRSHYKHDEDEDDEDDEDDEIKTDEVKVDEVKTETKDAEKDEEKPKECKITDIFNFKCYSKIKFMFISILVILLLSIFVLLGFIIYYFFFKNTDDGDTSNSIENDDQQPGVFDGMFAGLFSKNDELNNRSVIRNVSNISVKKPTSISQKNVISNNYYEYKSTLQNENLIDVKEDSNELKDLKESKEYLKDINELNDEDLKESKDDDEDVKEDLKESNDDHEDVKEDLKE